MMRGDIDCREDVDALIQMIGERTHLMLTDRLPPTKFRFLNGVLYLGAEAWKRIVEEGEDLGIEVDSVCHLWGPPVYNN